MKKILETERLYLREFNLEDSDFIFELVNTPQWIKYLGDREIKNRDDAEKYLLNGPMKSYKDNGFGLWMVFHKKMIIPIGMCGLLKRDYLENPDIGFAILPEHTNNGYAYEAAKAQ